MDKKLKICPECGVALIRIYQIRSSKVTLNFACPICEKVFPECEAEALNGGPETMKPTCDKCGCLLEEKFSNGGDTLHHWVECPECGAKDESKEATK